MLYRFLLPAIFFFSSYCGFAQNAAPKTENIIIVTFDGYRWQELFTGADKKLVAAPELAKDPVALKKEFWADTPEKRREKLMPFFWGTIARQGQLYGNRKVGSKMDVTNPYRFSYPGYSEIFCGHAFRKVNSNDYPDNPNLNIFDFMNSQPGYKGKVAAFATWDAFPRIINTQRSGVPVFVKMKKYENGAECKGVQFDTWQTYCPLSNGFISDDTLTYHFAKEYLKREHPRFAFIGFDETDEFAHEGKYDSYLHTAHQLDELMKDLWVFIQNDPQYRDKTTLLIACDHGRGHKGKNMWRHHGGGILDAHQIWLAAMGPDTPPLGELKTKSHYYQNQIAQTAAHLLGLDYNLQPKAGKAIRAITGEQP